MHVAINTSPLESGHKNRGIGIYTAQLTQALEKYEPTCTYSYFSKVSDIPKDTNLVHYPFFDPFFLTLPAYIGKPLIVTVHDLIPIKYPEYFPRGIRGAIKWQIQKQLLPRIGRRIITDSESSKKDIAGAFAYSQTQIDVVPLAPKAGFTVVREKNRLADVKKKYALNNKFVLYVGDVNWNKNIPGLVKSFSTDKTLQSQNFQLILVGKAFTDPNLTEAISIRKLIERLELSTTVKMVGFVSDEDLACLYSLAQMLVYPSLVEGFGFPVLEAMMCECPVVTSNVSSLMEVAGPSILVNPEAPSDIYKGMQMIIQMPESKRNEMVQKGLAWAGRFSWERTAQETVMAYKRALTNV